MDIALAFGEHVEVLQTAEMVDREQATCESDVTPVWRRILPPYL